MKEKKNDSDEVQVIDITEELEKGYEPAAALIAYRSTSGYYLETRPVLPGGRLGAAKSVSLKFLTDLASITTAREESQPHGPVPANLLYADFRTGVRTMVWWEPPQERMMYFDRGTGLKDGLYHMPGIIYKATAGGLYIWAFEGKKPSAKKRLITYPSFNQYADHRICLGDAKVNYPRDVTWQALEEHYRTLYWNSKNASQMHTGVREKVIFSNEMKKAAKKAFDLSVMMECKEKLTDLYK